MIRKAKLAPWEHVELIHDGWAVTGNLTREQALELKNARGGFIKPQTATDVEWAEVLELEEQAELVVEFAPSEPVLSIPQIMWQTACGLPDGFDADLDDDFDDSASPLPAD